MRLADFGAIAGERKAHYNLLALSCLSMRCGSSAKCGVIKLSAVPTEASHQLGKTKIRYCRVTHTSPVVLDEYKPGWEISGTSLLSPKHGNHLQMRRPDELV